MNKGIVKEGILGVLKLRWMSMFKNYRNKVKNSYPNNSIPPTPKGELFGDPVSPLSLNELS
jgi:hypothetical protein